MIFAASINIEGLLFFNKEECVCKIYIHGGRMWDSLLGQKIFGFQLKVFFFLLLLSLPLSFLVFFHPGLTHDARIVSMAFQSMVVVFGIFLFPLDKNNLTFHFFSLISFWLLWGWASVFMSPQFVASCLRQAEWTLLVLFGLVLYSAFKRWPDFVLACWHLYMGGFLILGFGYVMFWFILDEPASYNWVGGLPHFVNIRHFGHYICAALLVSAFYPVRMAVTGKYQWEYGAGFLFHSFTWGFLFWTGTRAGLLATLLGLFWILFYLKTRIYRVRFICISLCASFSGLAASTLFPVNSISLTFWNSLLRTIKRDGLDRISSGRLTHWKEVLEVMDTSWHTWLFGYGPDALRFHPGLIGTAHPHNTVLQGLIEWGIPGVTVFMILLVSGIYHAHQKMNCATHLKTVSFSLFLCASSLGFAYFFYGMLSGVFLYALPLTGLVFVIAVGAALAEDVC